MQTGPIVNLIFRQDGRSTMAGLSEAQIILNALAGISCNFADGIKSVQGPGRKSKRLSHGTELCQAFKTADEVVCSVNFTDVQNVMNT